MRLIAPRIRAAFARGLPCAGSSTRAQARIGRCSKGGHATLADASHKCCALTSARRWRPVHVCEVAKAWGSIVMGRGGGCTVFTCGKWISTRSLCLPTLLHVRRSCDAQAPRYSDSGQHSIIQWTRRPRPLSQQGGLIHCGPRASTMGRVPGGGDGIEVNPAQTSVEKAISERSVQDRGKVGTGRPPRKGGQPPRLRKRSMTLVIAS